MRSLYTPRICASLVLACALAAPACKRDDTMASTSDASTTSTSDDDASTSLPEVGWFDIGFGELAFEPLEDGGPLHIVWGSQGAAMFPMSVRGAEFTLPPDPKDFTDERAPILSLTIDIEGYNDGVGGHFKRIVNYAVGFDILPDGTYEYVYIPVIVPDTIDPRDLRGLPAHVRAQIEPHGSAPLVVEYDLVVEVDDPPRGGPVRQ